LDHIFDVARRFDAPFYQWFPKTRTGPERDIAAAMRIGLRSIDVGSPSLTSMAADPRVIRKVA
jgi:hypothetical protein